MPKAGFWSIGGYAISFRTDGRWYADEEVVENERIARLFSQHVQADGEGGWVIDIGIDRQPVTVEDTPLVVTAIEGDTETGFRVTTNDGVAGPLDPQTLRTGVDNVLYCDVERGERGVMASRFLRGPYYELAQFVTEIDGVPVLEIAGKRHRLDSGRD
jgi:hypothetical protein